MSTLFWDVTTCSPAEIYWLLEEKTASIFMVKPSMQQALCLLFVWLLFNPKDGDTPQKTVFFIYTTVRTSNLTHIPMFLYWLIHQIMSMYLCGML
jgi:hypothetical protein